MVVHSAHFGGSTKFVCSAGDPLEVDREYGLKNISRSEVIPQIIHIILHNRNSTGDFWHHHMHIWILRPPPFFDAWLFSTYKLFSLKVFEARNLVHEDCTKSEKMPFGVYSLDPEVGPGVGGLTTTRHVA